MPQINIFVFVNSQVEDFRTRLSFSCFVLLNLWAVASVKRKQWNLSYILFLGEAGNVGNKKVFLWMQYHGNGMVVLMQLQHVKFSLPKIFINIWKSTLKTYHGYKASLISIFFSQHFDLGKRFHNNKHVTVKKER